MSGSVIPLFSHSKIKNTFEVKENAFNDIKNQKELLERPVIVISIVGEYRRGKSYFMNKVIKYLQNQDNANWMQCEDPKIQFDFQGGSTRVTDGICMYSHAFPLGDKYAVILLDTEGTHDEKSTNHNMSLVFGCSGLISSLHIRNIHERITKQILSEFQFFAEFGKSAKLENADKPFQKLMLLVRDWEYPDENPYGLEGGEKHFQHWLEADEDGVEETLNTCYKDRTCYLMPSPGKNIKNASTSVCYDDMDHDFRDHIQQVVELIFSPNFIEAKTFGGNPILLKDFGKYFHMFADSLVNSKNVPHSHCSSQVTASNLIASEKARLNYKENMEKFLKQEILEIEKLEEKHAEYLKNVLKIFDETPKIGGENHSQSKKQELISDLEKWYDQYKCEVIFNIELQNIKDEKQRTLARLKVELHKIEMERQYQENIYKMRQGIKETDMNLQKMALENKKKTFILHSKKEMDEITEQLKRQTEELKSSVLLKLHNQNQALNNIEKQYKATGVQRIQLDQELEKLEQRSWYKRFIKSSS